MNNFKTSLTHYMDAGFPILFIDSFEDKKIFHVVRDVFSSRDFLEWNVGGIFDYNSHSISLQLSLSDSLELFLNDVDNAKNKVSINKNYLSHRATWIIPKMKFANKLPNFGLCLKK